MRCKYQCSLEHLVKAFSYTLCQDGDLITYNMYSITFLLYVHTYTSSIKQLQMTLENMCSTHRIIVVCNVQKVCFQNKVQGLRAHTPEGQALILTTFTSVIKVHCTYTPCYTVICSISQKNIHSACVTILTCC